MGVRSASTDNAHPILRELDAQRVSRGVTLKAWAAEARVSEVTMHRWLRGTSPSITQMDALAAALSASITLETEEGKNAHRN